MYKLHKLIWSIDIPKKRICINIFLSYDILTSSPLNRYNFLLNPANEALVGTRQPYFPVGGPLPPLPLNGKAIASSKWGGMEAGENMMYGVQVLDGMVHDECGPELLSFLQSLPEKAPFKDCVGQRIRCPVGSAISSPSFGSLRNCFESIIHTVSPFYGDNDWEQKLFSCYLNSFRLAWNVSRGSLKTTNLTEISIASPLLGAGCRGIPIDDAARLAALSCQSYVEELPSISVTTNETSIDTDASSQVNLSCSTSHRRLDFVLREEYHCNMLLMHMKNLIETL